jgi:catechol 2,3-dioxygenase-like lactoylglutathione lyase family enzyme
MLKIDRIHHVAYRCRDAKKTVLWYPEMRRARGR